MSLERAKVNCRRCYALAKPYIDTINYEEKCLKREIEKKIEVFNRGDRLSTIERNRSEMDKDDPLWEARNEAMRALEDYRRDLSSTESVKARSDRLLKTCANCDYSKPRIVEVIKGMEAQ